MLEGCSCSPSILIPLCTPGALHNIATLNLDHHTGIEEVNNIDVGK